MAREDLSDLALAIAQSHDTPKEYRVTVIVCSEDGRRFGVASNSSKDDTRQILNSVLDRYATTETETVLVTKHQKTETPNRRAN